MSLLVHIEIRKRVHLDERSRETNAFGVKSFAKGNHGDGKSLRHKQFNSSGRRSASGHKERVVLVRQLF